MHSFVSNYPVQSPSVCEIILLYESSRSRQDPRSFTTSSVNVCPSSSFSSLSSIQARALCLLLTLVMDTTPPFFRSPVHSDLGEQKHYHSESQFHAVPGSALIALQLQSCPVGGAAMYAELYSLQRELCMTLVRRTALGQFHVQRLSRCISKPLSFFSTANDMFCVNGYKA